jgi:hypothetical protein
MERFEFRQPPGRISSKTFQEAEARFCGGSGNGRKPPLHFSEHRFGRVAGFATNHETMVPEYEDIRMRALQGSNLNFSGKR